MHVSVTLIPRSFLIPLTLLPLATDLCDGQCGPVDLLCLQSSLSPGLDHMGAEEGSEGPKFCPIGILIVRWGVQLSQHGGTVFLQRKGKRGKASILRRARGKGRERSPIHFRVSLLEAKL